MKRIALLAALAAALGGTALAGQADGLDAKLARAASVNGAEGYAPSGWSHRGSLAEGGLDGLTVPLQAGKRYQIVGACGGTCDLDLQLLDAGGREVSSDEQPTDPAVVAVTPPRAQGYALRVRMSACAAAPCSYGVAAYVK